MSFWTTTWKELENAKWDFNLREYPIFDETYRPILNKKIRDHYLFCEIGLETPALFTHFLNRKMSEIMPYYNQLYKSQKEAENLQPFVTTKRDRWLDRNEEGTLTGATTDKETGNRSKAGTMSGTESKNETGESHTTDTGNETGVGKQVGNQNQNTTDNRQTTSNQVTEGSTTNQMGEQLIFSDTPQVTIAGQNAFADETGKISGNFFATNANWNNRNEAGTSHTEQDTTGDEKNQGTLQADSTINSNSTVDKTGKSDTTTSGEMTGNKSEETSENEDTTRNAEGTQKQDTTGHTFEKEGWSGYDGVIPEILEKWRKCFLNIDLMVIEQLRTLFMGVYG